MAGQGSAPGRQAGASRHDHQREIGERRCRRPPQKPRQRHRHCGAAVEYEEQEGEGRGWKTPRQNRPPFVVPYCA